MSNHILYQAGVMYAGLGMVIVKGIVDVGGFQRIWQVAVDGGRVDDLRHISPNPAQVFVGKNKNVFYSISV